MPTTTAVATGTKAIAVAIQEKRSSSLTAQLVRAWIQTMRRSTAVLLAPSKITSEMGSATTATTIVDAIGTAETAAGTLARTPSSTTARTVHAWIRKCKTWNALVRAKRLHGRVTVSAMTATTCAAVTGTGAIVAMPQPITTTAQTALALTLTPLRPVLLLKRAKKLLGKPTAIVTMATTTATAIGMEVIAAAFPTTTTSVRTVCVWIRPVCGMSTRSQPRQLLSRLPRSSHATPPARNLPGKAMRSVMTSTMFAVATGMVVTAVATATTACAPTACVWTPMPRRPQPQLKEPPRKEPRQPPPPGDDHRAAVLVGQEATNESSSNIAMFVFVCLLSGV